MKNRIISKIMQVADDHTLKLAHSLLSDYGSPLADELRDGNYLSIVSAPFPNVFAPGFADAYASRELMRKFPFELPGVDRDGAALRNFLKAEDACAVQNLCWANLRADPYKAPSFLRMMRVKIREILGKFSWEAASAHCGFGPGASYTLPRAQGDAFYKFGPKVDVTFAALPIADAVLKWRFPLWHSALCPTGELVDNVVLVPGNRVTFVPKDALKSRTIAIEPSLNMFLQKGIGGLIRARLRGVGLDLNQQQPVNQALAEIGSRDGSLATIDLSNASDTVSLALVEFLLPPAWYEAICATRSAAGVMPSGELIAYEKVSSMGNGFTFELESLIFLALALVCAPVPRVGVNVAVYGDDIIVPSSCSSGVLLALDCMGFTPNMSKTFTTGPFRESCGKHYLGGVDVTPLYVKEPINSPARLYWFANQVRRRARLSYGLDSRYRKTWDLAVSCLPRRIRDYFHIPDGVGDNGLVVDLDQAHSAVYCRSTWSWRAHSFSECTRKRVIDSQFYLLRSLWNLAGSAGVLPPVIGREEPREYWPGVKLPGSAYVRSFMDVREWSHHGPWL